MRQAATRRAAEAGRVCALALLALACPLASVLAATPAATLVPNIAQAAFVINGRPSKTASNAAQFPVAELLDVAVLAPQAVVSPTPGARTVAVAFKVTNTGNGREAFSVFDAGPGKGDDFAPAARRLVVDTNGDGVFDDGDAAYLPGQNDPVLAPGQSATVFIVCELPDAAAGRAQVSLEAHAVVGFGKAGTAFAGKGAGGVDAEVGATGAAAQASAGLYIGAVKAELVKSQSVVDPQGGSAAVPGSTVTYSLAARFLGSGSLSGVRLDDPLPAGAAYLPGSLKLDGSPVSDAGAIDARGVHLVIGALTAPSDHLVTFSVRIN